MCGTPLPSEGQGENEIPEKDVLVRLGFGGVGVDWHDLESFPTLVVVAGPENHNAVLQGRLAWAEPSRKNVPARVCPNGHSVLAKIVRSSRID